MNDQNSNNQNEKRVQMPQPKPRAAVPVRGQADEKIPASGASGAAEPARRTQMPRVRRPSASAESERTRMIDPEEIRKTVSARPAGSGAGVYSAESGRKPQQRPAQAQTSPARSGVPARVPAARTTTPARTSARVPGAKKPVVTPKNDAGDQKNKGEFGRGVVNNSVKAVLYIVFVLVISGCLSLFVIFVGNDIFAFVKDSTEVTVTIPQGATLSDIAQILGDNGVVKYPTMFKLYIDLRKKGADEYLYGDFTVSPSMPYDTLIATFKKAAATRKEITITFTEGMTVDEIIDKFIENGIGTREKFIDVIQNYPFDYWFVKELDKQIAKNPNSGRKYRLEGYLFPDTYNFYSDSTEEKALARLLDNFGAKFDDNYRLYAEQMGFTTDQIVTLASMVQKEAKFNNDYPLVSSVFHNRLKHTDVTGGKLESNATVQYTMPKEEVQLALSLEDIEKYDNAYNTYKYAGLPVGPICNPSLNALYFSLYPQDSDYYYFISNSQGFNLYARTWNEHQKNREKVESGS